MSVDMSRTSTYVSRDEDFLELPPMTFKLGSRADDSSDSDTERNELDERDGREKPLPAPPTSSTLSPPKPSARSSPSPISHISNFSTSTVSTSSSISSLPVTPVTPNTPITPFLSASPSSSSLLGAPLFTRAVSSIGARSRQPSIVSLAGGYHLPTMVAGKSSPIISHKTGLPVLNVIDLEDVDADVDGGHLRYLGEDTNTSRPSVRLNRNPSLGSAHTRTTSPLATDPVYSGVVRRYASAGNLLSGSSSRASSPGGHQYSHSHPLPFSTASPSPLSSFPTRYTGYSAMNTPTASVSDVALNTNESRTRSRSNSTGLRNAVYIQALDSKEVARRLLDLSSAGGEMDDFSDLSAPEVEPDDDPEQSKWSPASSVVDLRSPASKTSSDLAWGFPRPPKVHAPPPTPSTPGHTFPVAGPSNVAGDASALKSPILEERTRRRSFMSVGKRKSFLAASKSSADPLPPVPASPPANGDTQPPLLSTPGRRQRLASFLAKMARNPSSQASPIPSVPTSPTSASRSSLSVPPLAVRNRSAPHRPAPLDLSLKTKEPLSPILATESESAKGHRSPPRLRIPVLFRVGTMSLGSSRTRRTRWKRWMGSYLRWLLGSTYPPFLLLRVLRGVVRLIHQ
ncbi:hypothetical protein BDP27DRAFT_460482 [Rhodocollybia butyracea]|uniref:Uncharacterized protein n=1 Tax=Rhodocollybia butyracea TaxID=206335 RepID=A0A9P5Q0F1_9AGAR|nr:hypothetical protein BDP27DRAFT_460482 [Rhodocollybia butyracea]